MGERLRTFESGDTPHENNYSQGRQADLPRLASAGSTRPATTPTSVRSTADTVHDAVKADRWLEIVRNRDFKVTRRWDMGKELDEAGHPGMSSAVRPVAFTPDEKIMYPQVSFFHGLVRVRPGRSDPTGGGDYTAGHASPEPAIGRVTRVIQLPISEEVTDMPREQYVLDSAHHGLAINDSGTQALRRRAPCRTTRAIVDRADGHADDLHGRRGSSTGRTYSKPYWAIDRPPGNTCWVSMSGSDLVTVIDYGTEKVVAEVPSATTRSGCATVS